VLWIAVPPVVLVAEVGDHSSYAGGRGAAHSRDREEQLHNVVVHRRTGEVFV